MDTFAWFDLYLWLFTCQCLDLLREDASCIHDVPSVYNYLLLADVIIDTCPIYLALLCEERGDLGVVSNDCAIVCSRMQQGDGQACIICLGIVVKEALL